MGDEVEFLPADKHKSFLQDNSITLVVISQTGPKYQNNQFTISLQYLKENMKDDVEGFFELIPLFQMCVARHVQIT